MKDTLGLIPQVFYDLIGRVAPGAATLSMGMLLLTDDVQRQSLISLLRSPTAAIGALIIVGFLASYVLGFILGALASPIDDHALRSTFNAMAASTSSSGTSMSADSSTAVSIRFDDLAYMYDFILKHDPPAGARLAKLRAENHLCGAIIVGSLALAISYVFKYSRAFEADSILILGALVMSSVAAIVFQGHLRTRTLRLQINSWVMLAGSKPQVFLLAVAKKARIPIKPSTEDAQHPSHVATPPVQRVDGDEVRHDR